MLNVAELPLGSIVRFGMFTPLYQPARELSWQKVSNQNDMILYASLPGTYIFDSYEPGNSNPSRQNNGNNFFPHSNICQWLNSDASDGWYRAAHAEDYLAATQFTHKGFLAEFTHAEMAQMESVNVRGSVPTGSRSQYGKTYSMNCKVYLPSDVELTGRKFFDHDDVNDRQFEYYALGNAPYFPYHGVMLRTPYNHSVCCITKYSAISGYRSMPANYAAHCNPVIRLKPDTKVAAVDGHRYDGNSLYRVVGCDGAIDDEVIFNILNV